MKVLCLAKGYASYGVSILTTAAQHLELTLKDIEPADLALEITAFLPHDGPAKRTLERSLEQHILNFPQQVRARYREKAGKLDIQYPSGLREAESFGRPGGIYAVSYVLPRALDELSEAVVEGLRSKPAIWKKIDVSLLTDGIERSKASLPAHPDQISEYMRQLDELRRTSVKAPVSTDDLDIDWAEYHPTARKVLKAAFYWSEIDDDAPHGNDTGSDLLAAFKRWNRRNPTASYDGYVDRLLSRWGLTRGRIADDQLDWIRQEADIALAFAAIKLRGGCEEREARVAISALDGRLEKLGNAPDRAQKISLLRNALQADATEA